MLRRIFDVLGGLIIGLAVAASVHCGTSDGGGGGTGLVADASADAAGGGGEAGVPAWAAHRGDGACERTGGEYTDTYEYDGAGRLVREERRDQTGAVISRTAYEYDGKGRLQRSIDELSGSTWVYFWDC